MKRYYIDTEGNDDSAYKEAIEFACKYSKENNCEFDVILYALQSANIGWLERIYNRDIVKSFRNGHKLIGCNASIKIETKRTLKRRVGNSSLIVIAMGMKADDVFEIEDIDNVEVIIAIPWIRESLDKWVKSMNPIEMRGGETEIFEEIDCLIMKALEELTNEINLSTGISHLGDADLAKTMIRTFFKYEMCPNADQIEGYLVSQLSWNAKGAKEFTDLIRKMNEGKYFKGGSKTGLQNYYKSWKEQCE